jgi:hypothetical protein
MKEILCRCATAVADADTYFSCSYLQFSLIQTDERLNVVVLFFCCRLIRVQFPLICQLSLLVLLAVSTFFYIF